MAEAPVPSMPLSSGSAAPAAAAAAAPDAAGAAAGAAAEQKDDSMWKKMTSVFTGDDDAAPPRVVDVEAELAKKIEELPKDFIKIKLRAEKLDALDKLKRSSDPFVRIKKVDPATKLAETVIESTRGIIQTELNPSFEELTFPKSELNIDEKGDAGIIFEVLDFNVSGKYPLIGGCGGSLSSTMSGARKEFDLINLDKKKADSNYKNSGKLFIEEAAMVPSPQDVSDFKRKLKDEAEKRKEWEEEQAEKAAKAAKAAAKSGTAQVAAKVDGAAAQTRQTQ
ncbi:hypothetical protein DFJ74DRAFT_711493 [Hyaloraphidium curvatum]|nr:hypothetical protein DFJ74DRAFT_711493 [Hyaloraphidium curvatum]